MKSNKADVFITYLLVIFLLTTTLCSYFVCSYIISLHEYSYLLMGFGSIMLIYVIIAFIKKKLRFNIVNTLIIVSIILLILSTIFSLDIEKSLYGSNARGEGAFAIGVYFIIILFSSLIKSKRCKKSIINTIYIIGIINLIFGLIQIYDVSLLGNFYYSGYFSTGLVGNPNFFSSIMTICLALSICGFYSDNNSMLGIIPFTIGLFLANTLSGYVAIIGIIFVLLILTVFFIVKYKLYSYLYKLISIVFIISSSFVITLLIYPEYKERALEDANKSIGLESKRVENIGSGRIYIWSNTIKEIEKYWLIGVGTDNFKLIFDRKLYDVNSGRYIGKAHNEYLQIMVCEGVISAIVFLSLILFIYYKNIKKTFKYNNYFDNIEFMLLGACGAYSIQAFFNISVTRVAPIFYILLGLLIGNRIKIKKLKENPLVSVIIPTYNRKHISNALNSIKNQTYKNIEVIVIDDNVDSNISDYIKKEVNKYKKSIDIKYIKNKSNIGGSLSRNEGIKKSEGFFIALLDDDDEFYPNKIYRQVSYYYSLNNDNIAVITCNAHIYKNNCFDNYMQSDFEGNDLCRYVINEHTTTSTFLAVKEKIDSVKGFTDIKAHQEATLMNKLLDKKFEVYHLDEYLVRYNLQENDKHIGTYNLKYIETTKKYIEINDEYFSKLSKHKRRLINIQNHSILFHLYYLNNKYKEAFNEYIIIIKNSRFLNITIIKKTIRLIMMKLRKKK